MASGFTNRGRYNLLAARYRGVAQPATFYAVLFTNTTTPTADTNVKGDLTEINAGNGYTGNGMALTPGATDFDVFTEDDANDRAYIQTKDLVWSAAGGPIPASGTGAYYLGLTDNNATVANRDVDAFFDLTGPVSVSDGQSLTIQNPELRIA
ncbi:MAG: hypothetical protein OEZ43_21005 [Gammaproteobacteria bacterium]|nr:hypothetical protein [Gammaproteobacteria bacterium]